MARDYTKAENLDIIEREARERHIPVDDFMRFAYIETGGRFNEQASRGPNSAKGLFQFTPAPQRPTASAAANWMQWPIPTPRRACTRTTSTR